MLWGCACTASSLSITTGPQHFLFFSSLKIIHSPPSLSRSPLPYSMLGQSLFFVSFLLLLLLSFPPLEEEEDKENWCRASGCDCVSVLFSLVSLGVFWLLLSPARLGNRQTNVGIGCQQPPTLSLSAFLYYPPPAVLPRRWYRSYPTPYFCLHRYRDGRLLGWIALSIVLFGRREGYKHIVCTAGVCPTRDRSSLFIDPNCIEIPVDQDTSPGLPTCWAPQLKSCSASEGRRCRWPLSDPATASMIGRPSHVSRAGFPSAVYRQWKCKEREEEKEGKEEIRRKTIQETRREEKRGRRPRPLIAGHLCIVRLRLCVCVWWGRREKRAKESEINLKAKIKCHREGTRNNSSEKEEIVSTWQRQERETRPISRRACVSSTSRGSGFFFSRTDTFLVAWEIGWRTDGLVSCFPFSSFPTPPPFPHLLYIYTPLLSTLITTIERDRNTGSPSVALPQRVGSVDSLSSCPSARQQDPLVAAAIPPMFPSEPLLRGERVPSMPPTLPSFRWEIHRTDNNNKPAGRSRILYFSLYGAHRSCALPAAIE